MRRPGLHYDDIAEMVGRGEGVTALIAYCLEVELKYEGYIKRQLAQIKEVKRQEATRIPPDFDYSSIQGISLEAREKMAKIGPLNVGQASPHSRCQPGRRGVLDRRAGKRTRKTAGGTSMIDQNRLMEKAARYEIDAQSVAQKLDDYAAYLVEYNEKVNLTAITDPEGIEDRHFIDSLLLADCPEVAGAW